MMKNLVFILKSTLAGLILYALAALIIAVVVVNFFGSNHPHNMDEILYILLPILGSGVGAILGLIFSIIHLKDYSFKKVMKFLMIGLLVCVPLGILFIA